MVKRGAKKENYAVKATVQLDDVTVESVRCGVYLPERLDEKPKVVLSPNAHDAVRLSMSWKAALRAEVIGFNKKVELSIDSPEVYFSENTTTHWGEELSEKVITGEPQDLHVVKYFGEDQDSHTGTSQIRFWVSKNSTLAPPCYFEFDYTGNVKRTARPGMQLLIADGVKAEFREDYFYGRDEEQRLTQWSNLAIVCELNVSANDVAAIKQQLLREIDDILLLASFATRLRTACLGWMATNERMLADFYRGNYAFPKGKASQHPEDGVILPQNLESFIAGAYSALGNYDNKNSIRNAIYALVPTQPRDLEISFLSVFSGLESLVLDFRRRRNMEFVLTTDDWNKLKKGIKKYVKSSTEPQLEPEQRSAIYRKLDELNRISLKDAYDAFIEEHSIDLEDLWPVFTASGLVGLSDIRNKLVHGEPLPGEMYHPLGTALENLKYTLERILTCIFGWDLNKTTIRPEWFVRISVFAVRDYKVSQTKIADFVFSGQ